MIQLTPREVEVVQLVAQGLADKEVAKALGLSSLTVRNHLASARAKTGTDNRTKLALYAISRNLIPSPNRELRFGLFAEGFPC